MEERLLSHWIPSKEVMRGFLCIIDGICYSEFIEICLDNRGKSLNEWVAQRFCTDCKALTLRTRQEWQRIVDAESVTGSDMESFLGWHSEGSIENDIVCLTVVENDIIWLTDDGRRFRDNDEGLIRKIDEYEGMLFILGAIVKSEYCDLGEILADFEKFYFRFGYDPYFQQEKGLDSYLPDRLKYLEKRCLIRESDSLYQATEAGREYVLRCRHSAPPDSSFLLLDELSDVFKRRRLVRQLQQIDSYQFEHLIKCLLTEMGYKQVKVTSPSNDGGIDVIADCTLGISSVRQVIQAKKQQTNVGIEVVDRLRGSLHRGGQDLVNIGSIITTSGFTRSALSAAGEEGVPPIALVDGNHLLGLLIDYGIEVPTALT